MSTQVIDILLDAKDNASAAIKSVTGTIGELTGGLGKIAAFTGLFGSAVGITMGIEKSIEAANEQIRANTQLNTVLKSTGDAVGYNAKQIQDQANALMKMTTLGDDTIQQGQNMLLTFTNIGHDAFPKATKAMIDMATAMNGGATPSAEALRNQAIQLGKALNDPEKGMAALRRVGIAFTEQQKEQIITLQKSGDMLGAQTIILNELNKEFGGSAAAQAQTYAGRMEQINIAIGEIGETIGSALMPALTTGAGGMKEMVDTIALFFEENKDNIASIANTIRLTFEGIFDVVKTVFGAVWDVVVSVYTAIFGQTQVTGKGIAQIFADVMAGIVISIQVMAMGFQNGIVTIKAAFSFLLEGLSFVGTSLVGFIIGVVGAALSPIENLINGVIGGLNMLITAAGGTAIQSVTFATDLGRIAADTIKETWNQTGKDMGDTWGKFTTDIDTNTSAAVSKIQGTVKNFGGTVKAMSLEGVGAMDSFAGGAGGGENGGVGGAGKALKKAADEAKKLNDEIQKIKDAAEKSLSDTNTKIDSSKSKIMSMKEQYQALKDKIAEIGTKGAEDIQKITDKLTEQQNKIKEISGQGQLDIAKRMIEAQKELNELQKREFVGGNGGVTPEELQKIASLRAEIVLGNKSTTEEERSKALAESQKSQIQLIMDATAKKIADAEREKIAIELSLKQKQDSIAKELKSAQDAAQKKREELQKEANLYTDLINQRKALDDAYFKAFNEQIVAQQTKVQESINLMTKLNSMSGQSTKSQLAGIAGARASGGPVQAGKTYLVGEKGPELFTAPRDGSIIPNGGSSSNTIQINMGGVTVRNDSDIDTIVDKLTRKLQLYKMGIS